jgi:hypothetical protein
MTAQCLDDPGAILEKNSCLNAISKNIEGGLKLVNAKDHTCRLPECQTLKTVHKLTMVPGTNEPCDSKFAAPFAGKITVARLVTAFIQNEKGRGFHAGDFDWVAPGLRVQGRMSGVTNVGTHRAPVFKECQNCDDIGVMEGRLCGQVVESKDRSLGQCQIVAAYRIKFKPSDGGNMKFEGATLEGIISCLCVRQ